MILLYVNMTIIINNGRDNMRRKMKLLSIMLCSIMMLEFSVSVFSEEAKDYTVTIPCQFEWDATRFEGGLAVILVNGKYELINKVGDVIGLFEYDMVYHQTDILNQEVYFHAVENNKWGLLDKTGKLVIPCQYDSIGDIRGGIAEVGIGKGRPPGPATIDGLWGHVDINTGKEILPIKYNVIEAADDSLLYTVHTDNKMGVVNQEGKFIVPLGRFDRISRFTAGFAIVEKNEKFGVIDRTGKVIIPILYNEIESFDNGVALARKGDKYGVLNTYGNTVIPFNYSSADTKNGVSSMRKNGETTIFNKSGKIIASEGKYDAVYAVTDHLIYVYLEGMGVGAIDMSGKEIVPLIYAGVKETKNGIAIVQINERYSVINQYGKVVLPLDTYSFVTINDDRSINVVTKEGEAVLKDDNGNTILPNLPNEYDSIYLIAEGYYHVTKQEKEAIVDKEGNVVVPFGEYDFMCEAGENMVAVRANGLMGFISLKKYVAPPDAWAKVEVESAISLGLVPDVMQGEYQSNITRADFCQLSVNLIEVITGMKIDVFMQTRGKSNDVSNPIAFMDTNDAVIIAASQLGIVNGVGNHMFDPHGTIKREDAALMLQRTAKIIGFIEPNGTPQVFNDNDEFSSYAVDSIAFISAVIDKESGNKVMGGTGNNNFSPFGKYTRQQAYVTISRLYKAIRE